MAGFPFGEGVLTPPENDRLNTAFSIILWEACCRGQ